MKLKDSQLEIREVKKIQVVEKKWKRGWLLPRRDGGGCYRVGTPEDSKCLACEK